MLLLRLEHRWAVAITRVELSAGPSDEREGRRNFPEFLDQAPFIVADERRHRAKALSGHTVASIA